MQNGVQLLMTRQSIGTVRRNYQVSFIGNRTPNVHLRWCRVHNGEFQQPRRSYEGLEYKEDDSGIEIFRSDR